MDGCHSKVNNVRMLENISKIKRFDTKFTLVEISVQSRQWLNSLVFVQKLKGLASAKASPNTETF